MKKVLVIDDSDVSLYLIQTIFEDDPDVQIELENNSKRAYSHIKSGHPDLLIMDLMMPNINGFQLIQQIKADPELKSLPIIVVSARHDKESIEKVESFGITDYIKKPIRIGEIEDKVRQYLYHAQHV